MANFAELSLFAATPEQVQESRKRSHASWARGLSMEAYLQRDSVMDLWEHALDGKLVTWYVPYFLSLSYFCNQFSIGFWHLEMLLPL